MGEVPGKIPHNPDNGPELIARVDNRVYKPAIDLPDLRKKQQEGRKEDDKARIELQKELGVIDPSDLEVVDSLRHIPGRQIVRLNDGRLALHHVNRGSIYLAEQGALGTKLVEYDDQTGAMQQSITPGHLGDLSKQAFEAMQKMQTTNTEALPHTEPLEEKESTEKNSTGFSINEEPPETIDVSGLQVVDKLPQIKGREIVKLKDGKLALHHIYRGLIFIEKKGKFATSLIGYDVETGKMDGMVSPGHMGESSQQAYAAMKQIKA